MIFKARCVCVLSFLLLFQTVIGETVRVATLNLKNYLIMDRMVDGRWRPKYPKPEKEKTALREAIVKADADILMLQEVGELPFLMELQADLKLDGLDYEFAYHSVANDPVRHLAALSKIEAVEVVTHRDMDFKYFEGRELVKRGLFELGFRDASGELYKVFGVHLKSRWSDIKTDPGSELRRVREAEACRNRMIDRTVELNVNRFMVAGDFNDHPDSSAFRRFEQRGDLKTADFIWAEDDNGEVWTYYYAKHGTYSLVDGFFVSEAWLDSIVEGSPTIIGWHQKERGSDHRLVYLDLEL